MNTAKQFIILSCKLKAVYNDFEQTQQKRI